MSLQDKPTNSRKNAIKSNKILCDKLNYKKIDSIYFSKIYADLKTQFPIRLWNVGERVFAHKPRTNNSNVVFVLV